MTLLRRLRSSPKLARFITDQLGRRLHSSSSGYCRRNIVFPPSPTMKLLVWGSALAAALEVTNAEYEYILNRSVCCARSSGAELPNWRKAANVAEQLATAIEALKPNADCRTALALSEGLPHENRVVTRPIFRRVKRMALPAEDNLCVNVHFKVRHPRKLSRKPNYDYFMPSDFEHFSEVSELDGLAVNMGVFHKDGDEPEHLVYQLDFSREDAMELPDDLLLDSSVDDHGGRQARAKPDKFRRAMQYLMVTGWPDAPYSEIMKSADVVEVGHPVRNKSKRSRSRSGSRSEIAA